MAYFFDLVATLTVLLMLLSLAINGVLTAAQVGILLVIFVFLQAAGRALRSGLTRLVLRIALPLTALLLFAATHGGGHTGSVVAIVGQVLILLIILGGLYVMFRGWFVR